MKRLSVAGFLFKIKYKHTFLKNRIKKYSEIEFPKPSTP